MGGSDSSRTRQGGINLTIKLAAMIISLLVRKLEKNRENSVLQSVDADFFIDINYKFTHNLKVFSTPKALLIS